jgi:hypothetical protein
MSTREKTWRYASLSFQPVDGWEVKWKTLWWTKQLATGALTSGSPGAWSLMGSSGWATYGINDGVDRWGSTFIRGNYYDQATAAVGHGIVMYGQAYPPFARAMAHLRSPGTKPLYMVLSTAEYLWQNGNMDDFPYAASQSIFYSPTVWAGGSATTNPGPSGGVYFGRNAYVCAEGTGSGFTARYAPTNWFRLYGALCDDGSFYVIRTQAGSGYYDYVHIVSALTSAKSPDTCPWYTYEAFSLSNFLPADIATTTTNAASLGPNGAAAAAGIVVPYYYSSEAYGGVNILTGQGPDNASQTQWDLPCWVVCGSSFKGRMADFALTGANNPVGTVEPDSIAPTSMCVGGLWVPYNAVPSL